MYEKLLCFRIRGIFRQRVIAKIPRCLYPIKKRGFSQKKVARLLKRPLFVVFRYIKPNGRRKVNKQKKAAKNSGLVFLT